MRLGLFHYNNVYVSCAQRPKCKIHTYKEEVL